MSIDRARRHHSDINGVVLAIPWCPPVVCGRYFDHTRPSSARGGPVVAKETACVSANWPPPSTKPPRRAVPRGQQPATIPATQARRVPRLRPRRRRTSRLHPPRRAAGLPLAQIRESSTSATPAPHRAEMSRHSWIPAWPGLDRQIVDLQALLRVTVAALRESPTATIPRTVQPRTAAALSSSSGYACHSGKKTTSRRSWCRRGPPASCSRRPRRPS